MKRELKDLLELLDLDPLGFLPLLFLSPVIRPMLCNPLVRKLGRPVTLQAPFPRLLFLLAEHLLVPQVLGLLLLLLSPPVLLFLPSLALARWQARRGMV